MWIGECDMDWLVCPKCGNENPSNLNTVSVDTSGIFIYFYCDLCKTTFYRHKLYWPVHIESSPLCSV